MRHRTILLGSNNIRKGWAVEDVIALFKEIAEHASKIKNCHLVLVGLLPDPTKDNLVRGPSGETLGAKFRKASSQLRCVLIDCLCMPTRVGFL